MINQKGGVGKTTSVVNIGAGLADMKKKVLVVDLDPQAHLTYSLGVKADEVEITVYQLLKGESAFEQTLIETSNLKMIPASIDLASAEIELSTEVGREAFLKNVLEKVSGFDFVLLDCPPNLGLLTLKRADRCQRGLCSASSGISLY